MSSNNEPTAPAERSNASLEGAEVRTSTPLRKTGLKVLGDRPWGGHFALFYAKQDDLIDICVPFLRAGLENNEICAWVIGPPLSDRDAWVALATGVPDIDRFRAERRIEILHSETWYLTGDTPDLQKAGRGWEKKLDEALARGYEGMRVAAIVPKLEEHEWVEFFAYEERLNHFLSGKPMLVLCAYPIHTPRAADVARTHPSIIAD